MAQTQPIDALLDQVNALERCARAVAQERDDEASPARPSLGAVATRSAAQALRTATRSFPLLALAAAFGLGAYAGSRFAP
jgi:hypothetical protein